MPKSIWYKGVNQINCNIQDVRDSMTNLENLRKDRSLKY
jgi:hypothetical protein